MRFYLFALLIFIFTSSNAAVYMQTDKNGNITYSDIPLPQSKEIELPSIINTTPSVQQSSEVITNDSQEEVINHPYTQFSILSPKDQETIQNQPTINVDIALKPNLQKGDKIQLLLDGKLIGDPAASIHLQLPLIERGVHQLYAVIINEKQQVIQQTNPVTIFIHRANLNSSPALKVSEPSSNLMKKIKAGYSSFLSAVIPALT